MRIAFPNYLPTFTQVLSNRSAKFEAGGMNRYFSTYEQACFIEANYKQTKNAHQLLNSLKLDLLKVNSDRKLKPYFGF